MTALTIPGIGRGVAQRTWLSILQTFLKQVRVRDNFKGYFPWEVTGVLLLFVYPSHTAAVFGTDSVGYGKRVRPVLSGQIVQPINVGEGLRYLETVWGPPNSIIHSIAGAPYFNIAGGYNNYANLTIDEVFVGFNLSSTSIE